MKTSEAGLWALVHAERAALAKDLAGLSATDWDTPSRCEELTVREVLAHLTAAANLTPLRWLAGVVRCRFDFDKQVAMRLAEHLGASAAETLARFDRVVSSTRKPPLPVVAMLGEVVVHGEDIRGPLGIHSDRPMETLTRVAEFYSGSDLMLPSKKHTRGLRLVATDGPFDSGSGPRIAGGTLALIMAMTGRTAYLDELDGDGVDVLRQRYRAG